MEQTFYQVDMGDFFVESGMLNHLNILHGGILLKHCDSTVGVLANRYSHSRVVTVAIKHFNFSKPAHVADRVWFRVTLLKTGHHSMTFYTEIFRQGFEEQVPTKIGDGILVFVAVDAQLKPSLIAPFTITDADQQSQVTAIMQKFNL